MIGVDIAAGGLVLAALTFLLKATGDMKRDAAEAAMHRERMSGQLEIIVYRVTRIEKHLDENTNRVI
ncbi:hypothetical protein BV372_08000 [Nostoc sp. T09]|uniref:hypothetical protein n=1 Tax=Nostoc sp. T09 TaxID=1932621 RepID=UPI000A3A0D93|nr:hypothetical protein [Nostoc sp. T09]OUL36351.1 hypothetical protein BV372_08000 [Nostoc sp. T09]